VRKLLIYCRRKLGTPRIARQLYRRLPSERRCKECWVPFHGFFAIPFSILQIRPSRKNPNLCTL
jgi:adenylate cyclase